MRRMIALARVISVVASAVLSTSAVAEPAPVFNIISEEASGLRRSLAVRLERRLDEVTLMNIATTLKARSTREVAKTQISFFLPGMVLNQGAWANVLFAPDPRLVVSGLRLEDEELLSAEFKADTRSMLGSWLTSPPAPAGRLTIYSDHGRIFAEWRLRSGLKTVEELREANVGKVRRFDMSGGGYYVLTKSGDIEIWDQTTLIAVGERLRIEPDARAVASRVAPAGRSALGGANVAALSGTAKPPEQLVPAPAIVAGERALPVPPATATIVPAPVAPKPAVALANEVPIQPVVIQPIASEQIAREKAGKKGARKPTEAVLQVKSKPRVDQADLVTRKSRSGAQAAAKARGQLTPGDRITTQLTGGF